MDIQKVNNLPATLQTLSQSALCRTLQTANFKATADRLPKTIKDALDEPPIAELVKVVPRANVVRYVEFELVKLTSLVSVGSNLNDSQIQFIADQLVDMFPAESLADFKICFERGCMGQYGEIFRMDGVVLRKWMTQYLDEKYAIIEQKLIKDREAFPHELPKESEVGPGRKLFDEYANSLKMGTKVPDISQDEINRTGQREPPKKKAISYHSSPESVSNLLDMKTEYGILHTDKLTGKTLPGHPTFQEWFNSNDSK
jgi:hypothetical protein